MNSAPAKDGRNPFRIYGLTGFPLGHSFSKAYFTGRFRQEHVHATYELFPLEEISHIRQLVQHETGICGLNVTIPHKESVIAFLDDLSEEASAIGAVNTISIARDNGDIRLKGWNTDAPAFESELLKLAGRKPGSALVLGNGGAARAVIFILQKLGWEIVQAGRKIKSGLANQTEFKNVDDYMIRTTRLIVNCTPVGMLSFEESIPGIPLSGINSDHLLFDLVYNPPVTHFLKTGAEAGAKTVNGLGMLYKQADLAWEIWQRELQLHEK